MAKYRKTECNNADDEGTIVKVENIITNETQTERDNRLQRREEQITRLLIGDEEEFTPEEIRFINDGPYLHRVQIPDRQPVLWTLIHDDKQNVHDTGVQDSVKKIVDKEIRPLVTNTTPTTTLDEIEKYANKKEKGKKLQNILSTIGAIRMNDGYSSKHEMKITECVDKIWHKITADETKKENLLDELDSCVENGHVMCTTGIFNRIVDTLNTGEENKIVNSDYLRNELMGKMGKYRDEATKNAKNNDKTEIEKNVRLLIDKDYKDSNSVDQNALKIYVDEMIKYL